MDFTTSYDVERSAVFAENMIATSQPLATQAGVRVLQSGGNAIDAALAAAIVLTVVEPTGNGVGSDAIALIFDGKKVTAINGTGHSPSSWDRERFKHMRNMPLFGWDAITVPGAVKLWWDLSERYGRMFFPALFENAIEYAKNGYHVGNKVALEWSRYSKIIESPSESFKKEFNPIPSAGDWILRKELGLTLEEIASTNAVSFYEGDIAKSLVNQSNKDGGSLNIDDLASFIPEWVEPIKVKFRDSEILEMPPNSQGVHALVALGILNYLPIAEMDSTDFFHYQIEAMKLSFKLCQDLIADPSFNKINHGDLLDSKSLCNQAAQINRTVQPFSYTFQDQSKDTVYLAAADKEGLMVSFIQSNYLGFGSGVVIKDKGIALHNRGAGFSLDPNHPNVVGPRKRPFHTIMPGMVTKAGQPSMVFGVMGGPMQPQGHLQLLDRIISHELNPQSACDAPRWQLVSEGKVIVEPAFSKTTFQELSNRGHNIHYENDRVLFGGAQVIQKIKGGYVGGSDSRKEGCAAGF